MKRTNAEMPDSPNRSTSNPAPTARAISRCRPVDENQIKNQKSTIKSAGDRSPFDVLTCRRFDVSRPGFTLIELMVVVGIIALLIAIAVPSIGPMMKSNQAAQVANTLNALTTMAQTAAEANLSPVAVRIERAFKIINTTVAGDTRTDPPRYEQMDKTLILPKQAKWEPYQQARLVLFATPRPGAIGDMDSLAFSQMNGSKVMKLPETSWLAPGNCLDDAFGTLEDNKLMYSPRLYSQPTSVNGDAVPFSRLENFYIVFSRQGGTMVMTASDLTSSKNHYWYKDETQPYWDSTVNTVVFPYVDHPDNSARGVLIYDRKEFEQIPNNHTARRSFLAQTARSIFINRSLGSGVEGRHQ